MRALAALALLLAFAGCGSSRHLITVHVGGRTVRVAHGTTLATLHLKPRSGNLLAVGHTVLRNGVVPGRVLVNGRPELPSAQLRDGDRIALVAGADREEPLATQRTRLPHGLPENPQFFLARTPGTEVVVRGAISHKLVSARFEASGKAKPERAVALTFDDGPSPQFTSRIVRVLRRLHVPATFFVIGYLAETYPSLVRLEVRAHMTVGNHSYNHPEVPPFDRLPTRLVDDEIELSAEAIRKAGADPKLFRPPAGSFSSSVVAEANRYGEHIVLWSVDPGDWEAGATAASITRRVLAAVRPGSIVILHDGGGDRTATLRALPAIVKGIRRRGLKLVAVPAA